MGSAEVPPGLSKRQQGASNTGPQTGQRGGGGGAAPRPGSSTATRSAPAGGPPSKAGLDGPFVTVASVGQPGLAIPSRRAVDALLLVPLLLWAVAVGVGTIHYEGLLKGGARAEAMRHPLVWYDRCVRTGGG